MKVDYRRSRRNHGAKRAHHRSGINRFGARKKRSEQRNKLWALRNPNGANEEPKGNDSTKKKDTCRIWVGGREDEF